MIRALTAWLLITVHNVADWLASTLDTRHLTTDPACIEHKTPTTGSRLDRASRGIACVPCMIVRAFALADADADAEGWGDAWPPRDDASSTIAALNALGDLIDSARTRDLDHIAHNLDAARTRLIQDGTEYLDAAWAFVDAGRQMIATSGADA